MHCPPEMDITLSFGSVIAQDGLHLPPRKTYLKVTLRIRESIAFIYFCFTWSKSFNTSWEVFAVMTLNHQEGCHFQNSLLRKILIKNCYDRGWKIYGLQNDSWNQRFSIDEMWPSASPTKISLLCRHKVKVKANWVFATFLFIKIKCPTIKHLPEYYFLIWFCF